MSISNGQALTGFDELKPGDRIEVRRSVVVEGNARPETIYGTVVRTERRRGPSCFFGRDDGVRGDVILLELCDGELTVVPLDESTVLRRA